MASRTSLRAARLATFGEAKTLAADCPPRLRDSDCQREWIARCEKNISTTTTRHDCQIINAAARYEIAYLVQTPTH